MLFPLSLLWLAALRDSQAISTSVEESGLGIFPRQHPEGPYCCKVLQQTLGTLISFPGSATYLEEQNGTLGYWSAFEDELSPSCRVTPLATHDVSRTLSILAATQCQFAVRGGGHMWFAGAANIQDGVTIDLSSMAQVAVSADRKTTSAGPGARWEDVSFKLDPMHLAVVGGRVHDVGIAGLTLGGGNSWFAAQYGFVCDNVAKFEIVIASGEVLNANISSHPDLFKALKGGLNNFGIVTSFDFKTFEQGNIWGGFVVLPWTTTANTTKQLQLLEKYGKASQAGQGETTAVEQVYAFNGTKELIILNILVDTNNQANPPLLREFVASTPQLSNTLRSSNISDHIVEAGGGQAGHGVKGSSQAGGIPNGGRYTWASATFPNNATILEHILSLIPTIFNFTAHGSLSPGLSFQPVTSSITRHSAASGGNSLGLSPADENTVWMNFAGTTTDPRDDKAFLKATESFIRKARGYTQSQGQYMGFLYANYALASQDPFASYGEENQATLQAVSKKYDPNQVFQKLVPGGFKLYRKEPTCC